MFHAHRDLPRQYFRAQYKGAGGEDARERDGRITSGNGLALYAKWGFKEDSGPEWVEEADRKANGVAPTVNQTTG